MAYEGTGLRRSALLMTRWPVLVRCYAVTSLARSVHATACPVSDGVAGAVRGIVVRGGPRSRRGGPPGREGRGTSHCRGRPKSGVPAKVSFSSWVSSGNCSDLVR